MKKSIAALLLTAAFATVPLQAQNLDNLTPEQQKQLLTLLLKQQMGGAAQPAQAPATSPIPATFCSNARRSRTAPSRATRWVRCSVR